MKNDSQRYASAGRNEPRIDAEEFLEGIPEWVRIESPSHDAEGVNRMVDRVESQMRPLHGRVRSPDPRRSRRRRTRRPQLRRASARLLPGAAGETHAAPVRDPGVIRARRRPRLQRFVSSGSALSRRFEATIGGNRSAEMFARSGFGTMGAAGGVSSTRRLRSIRAPVGSTASGVLSGRRRPIRRRGRRRTRHCSDRRDATSGRTRGRCGASPNPPRQSWPEGPRTGRD